MKKNAFVLVLAALMFSASVASAIGIAPRPRVERLKFATYPNGVQTTLSDTCFSAGIGNTLYTDVSACTTQVIDMRGTRTWAPGCGSNIQSDGQAAFLVIRCSFAYDDTVMFAVESSPDGINWEKETDTSGMFHPITGCFVNNTGGCPGGTDGYNFILPIEADFDAVQTLRGGRVMSPFIRVLIKPGLTAQVLAGMQLYLHYFEYDETDMPILREPVYRVKRVPFARAISTGTVDSLEVLMSGCSVADTSAAISTADFSTFSAYGGRGDGWGGSEVKFWVTSSSVTATDTLSIALQGSYDGTNWVATRQNTTEMAGQAAVNNNVYVYPEYAHAYIPAMSPENDLLMWPYIRVIIYSDRNNTCVMNRVGLYCGAWRNF